MYGYKLRMTESQFREYLLENYVDENGVKVSDRELIRSEKFMIETGLYTMNGTTGELKPCSLGNISYWKKKLGLYEYEVYLYHREKGTITTSYLDWAKKVLPKEYKVVDKHEMKEKDLLIETLGLPINYREYSLEIVKESAQDLWDMLGLDPEIEYNKIRKLAYNQILKEHKEEKERKKKEKEIRKLNWERKQKLRNKKKEEING